MNFLDKLSKGLRFFVNTVTEEYKGKLISVGSDNPSEYHWRFRVDGKVYLLSIVEEGPSEKV